MFDVHSPALQAGSPAQRRLLQQNPRTVPYSPIKTFYRKSIVVGARRSATPVIEDYNDRIQSIRDSEYPQLRDTTYLDHAGMTSHATSLIDAVAEDLKTNLFGNPHSANASSRLSSSRIEGVRSAFLQYLNADPAHFDLVFTANATAAIKIVAEGFREQEFRYYYYKDAHTSLIGIRELASAGSHCFTSDEEVDEWIEQGETSDDGNISLFAYPAQSNMTGYRPPVSWCERLRKSECAGHRRTYTLLDAASYLTTGRLDLSNPSSAPDFISLSFHKIFGFPDLGALIVKKDAGHMLTSRKYFGGGTVGMVISVTDQWHAMRQESIHDALEDGTLPLHTIPAIGHALDVQSRLFGSAEQISQHATRLSASIYQNLTNLRHWNNVPVIQVYQEQCALYGDADTQGPIIAFNVRRADGTWVGKSHFETLAAACSIQLRSGGVCNPGGIAIMLQLEPWKMRRNYCTGMRCGDDLDIIGGQPTGILRVSLGAMSAQKDVDTFIRFVEHFFVEMTPETKISKRLSVDMNLKRLSMTTDLSTGITPVEYFQPISLPQSSKRSQYATSEACFAFHNEWCIVDRDTFQPLTPTKALKTALDVVLSPEEGTLVFKTVSKEELADSYFSAESGRMSAQLEQQHGVLNAPATPESSSKVVSLIISLWMPPPKHKNAATTPNGRTLDPYPQPDIADFFSRLAGRPCTLARYRPRSSKNVMQTCAIANCCAELADKAELEVHYALHAKSFENLDLAVSMELTDEVTKWHKLRYAYRGRMRRG